MKTINKKAVKITVAEVDAISTINVIETPIAEVIEVEEVTTVGILEKNNINIFGNPITKPKPTGFAALDNIISAKKTTIEKAEPKIKTPSAYGITIEAVCKNPAMKIEGIKEIVGKELGIEPNMVSLRTIYTDVHRVINLLTKNGFMPIVESK